MIAEDEDNLRWALGKIFNAKGLEVVLAADGKEALERMADPSLGVALIDIRLPAIDGMELLSRAREVNPDLRVIMMTAHGSVDTTVSAMKMGAFDYLPKPFEIEEVEGLVAKAFSARSLYREVATLREELKQQHQLAERLIGQSRPMLELYKALGKVSQTDATVLLVGESGTGKELVARTIHSHSLRFARPFVAINSAAIPRDLLEAELFGFQRGAFTGAIMTKKGKLAHADRGTLFLDEVGDMPLELQAKLLRVLEQREYEPLGSSHPVKLDVRLIAATNQRLEEKVAKGEFRSDLYYRVNVISLKLPALRERRDDIPLLVEHFAKKYQEELAVGPRYFSTAAQELMISYDWPGNVRELQNVVRRSLVLSCGPAIQPEELSLAMEQRIERAGEADLTLERVLERSLSPLLTRKGRTRMEGLYDLVLKQMERPLFKLVLKATGGNKLQAARLLGINRNTLAKKLVSLKLDKLE